MGAGAGRISDLIGDRTEVIYVGNVAVDGAPQGTLFIAPCDCTVEVDVSVTANTTGDTTSFHTITIYDAGATGTGATSMGALALGYGTDLTANQLRAVTLTSDDLDAGDVARFAVAATGGGLLLTNLSLIVTWWPI